MGSMISGNESGSTLVVVMIITIVMLITTFAVVELGAQDAALAVRDVRASQALYMAEAGLERAHAWLQHQQTRPTTAVNPFGDYADTLGGGLYFSYIIPEPGASRPVYRVTSVATLDGRTRAVETLMTPRSFTDYLYFTNRDVGPGSPGYFRTGDVIDGPIHLNDEICIWGDPIFENRVESTWPTMLYHNDWNPVHLSSLSNPPYDIPDFRGGCELGTAHMEWLAQPDVNTLKNMADLSISNAEIVFGRDAGAGPMLGWMSYRKIGNTTWNDVEISSFNGIVYVNGDCTVQGILDGQVTICSNTSISIVDDIVYADSDANGPLPGCDDMLGLVASVRVYIDDTPANYNDCVVHGHLLAINNQASLVEHYDQGTPRGTLTIYGGLAQDKWGPVGTGYYDMDGNLHVLTGYVRDVHYDWRLQTMLPPGYYAIMFPGVHYARLGWREITPPFTLCGDVEYTQGS
jgi:hypothetical protein